jgi:hypothetical protein
MAAKLEWNKYDLMMGPFELAYVLRQGSQWKMLILAVPGTMDVEKARYETDVDAMQDCESEVRRLLKEAGVECG